MAEQARVRWLSELCVDDLGEVGGKNASLGEMMRHLGAAGIRVPPGFATTTRAYYDFLDAADLHEVIRRQIDRLHAGAPLPDVGAAIREAMVAAEWPDDLATEIVAAYRELGGQAGRRDPDVAVRSSATAEDLPTASFAGQQDTFLNVTGPQALLDMCRRCYASLFTDRAISYREDHGFDHAKVALSVGVQLMVRSDLGCAGVAFSIDTDSGFDRAVLVNASWGLGEAVVGGCVDPDEYLVFKPLLDDPAVAPILSRTLGEKATKIVYADAPGQLTRTVETGAEERDRLVLDDAELLQLARWVMAIERHYGRPMDVEWARDGLTGELFVVQARPETVHSCRDGSLLQTYRLTGEGERLVSGLAVGEAIAVGRVCNLASPDDIDDFQDGAVLVTPMTDPDWEPIMKRAAAIVTDHGGRTSHAAIVSRELGVAALVGAGDATSRLEDGREVTVSCAEGEHGHVYDGVVDHEVEEVDLSSLPHTRTAVMLNLADPSSSFRWWRLPASGVGLARLEFVVANHVKVHPLAALHPERLDDDVRAEIARVTRGYDDPAQYVVAKLAHGIARIAASRWPDPVIVRMSDFKSNEYAELLGGAVFEPAEENPMLGWRGASRYTSAGYRDGFALECAAIRRVREDIGLANVVVMIPFCRTVAEADRVLAVLADNGLARGVAGLEVFVMAEVPSNIILADEFAQRFDGFSIGSNDLTQLTLGVDRDSERLAELFDERNPAVTRSIERLITEAHARGAKVGLCGQRPSDDPEFAGFLVRAGIDSISVTPDSFLKVVENVAAAEHQAGIVAEPC